VLKLASNVAPAMCPASHSSLRRTSTTAPNAPASSLALSSAGPIVTYPSAFFLAAYGGSSGGGGGMGGGGGGGGGGGADAGGDGTTTTRIR